MTPPDSATLGELSDDGPVSSVEFHPPSGTFRTEFDFEGRTVSEAVISAVASAHGCDHLELPSLYSTVDPDALDALFAPRASGHVSTEGSIEFQYAGHTVTVNAHGTIAVAPTERSP